jgi:hydroxyacylglutathione hydrolase
MTIKQFVFSPFQENTYVISADNKDALILDPGCFNASEEQKLLDYIKSEQLNVKFLVNTHLHLDHIFGNVFVEKSWEVKTSANAMDAFWLETYEDHCRLFGVKPPSSAPSIGHVLKEGDSIQLGNEIFKILEVPGHSPGSIALYHSDGFLFAGDVLFKGSIGRTDLEQGNYAQLINGITNKLLILPDETVVYSGHGDPTTIGFERKNNPFL